MVQKPIETYCNESCGKQMEVKGFKNKKLRGGIEKIYFNCPNCNHEYVLFYTDAQIRNLQSKMKKLRRKIERASKEQLPDLVIDWTTLQKEIAQAMNHAKKRAQLHEP